MFHVKPNYMKAKKNERLFMPLIFCLCCFNCYSQKEGEVALGLSLNYGFGREFNNCASNIRIDYNFFERFRISPSFSYYFNKNNMKMNDFSINFHYLFPDFLSNSFQIFENHDICFYPIAGFFISNFLHANKNCTSCFVDEYDPQIKYLFNFGFDFGAGVEYKLPTLLPLLRNMYVNFEMKCQMTDNYSRPTLSFGALYKF